MKKPTNAQHVQLVTLVTLVVKILASNAQLALSTQLKELMLVNLVLMARFQQVVRMAVKHVKLVRMQTPITQRASLVLLEHSLPLMAPPLALNVQKERFLPLVSLNACLALLVPLLLSKE